jgi:phosphoribosyl-AMP cyclohydrolase
MKEKIDFKKSPNCLIPTIIQDYKDGTVYMLGYVNELSLQKTQKNGYVHFWSRSRNKLWLKGEESGNKLKVIEILTDCDNDTLLIKVKLEGSHVCHTGNKTCFFKKITV